MRDRVAFAARPRVCLIDEREVGPNSPANGCTRPARASSRTSASISPPPACRTHRATVAIFPKGAEPIVLPYVGGEFGIGCQHHLLVEALQKVIAAHPEITVLSGCRAVEVARGRVTAVTLDRAKTVEVARTGRRCRRPAVGRAAGMGYSGACQPLSYMAGVLIDADALPSRIRQRVPRRPRPGSGVPRRREQGPRVHRRARGPRRVDSEPCRIACRVPADATQRNARRVDTVRLPRSARGRSKPVLRRRQYGRAGVALVGDAVGHCHPLCAVGMSVGFLNADTLAKSKLGRRVRRGSPHRRPHAGITLDRPLRPLRSSDAGTTELRDAVYHLWRTSAAATRRPMRSWPSAKRAGAALGVTFARLLATASRQVVAGVFDRPLAQYPRHRCRVRPLGRLVPRESLTDRVR